MSTFFKEYRRISIITVLVVGSIITLVIAVRVDFTQNAGVDTDIKTNSVDSTKVVLSDIIEGKRVEYERLGASVQDMNVDLANYFGIEDGKGVVIIDVFEDGLAEAAGMKSGDVIRSFNGNKVENLRQLLRQIRQVARAKADTMVNVGVIREGRKMTFSIPTERRPAEGQPANKKEIIGGKSKTE